MSIGDVKDPNNRIKKLYLVDADTMNECNIKLPTSVPTPTTAAVGTGATSQIEEIVRNENEPTYTAADATTTTLEGSGPFSDPYEDQAVKLDGIVHKILRNKKLPVRLKLLEYLRAMKSFLFYRDKVEASERAS